MAERELLCIFRFITCVKEELFNTEVMRVNCVTYSTVGIMLIQSLYVAVDRKDAGFIIGSKQTNKQTLV